MNKFKVEDKVIYSRKTAKIFGVAEKKDWLGQKYAISFISDCGDRINTVVDETELQSAEIEVGDTVKYHYNKRCEVVEIKDERDMVGRNVLLKVFYEKGWRYRTADIDNLDLIEKGDNNE